MLLLVEELPGLVMVEWEDRCWQVLCVEGGLLWLRMGLVNGLGMEGRASFLWISGCVLSCVRCR